MSNASFVRRAPEIAEEILAKTANLPKDLKSFARNLFEKEASAETGSLKMPARMTIADLRKIAAGNKVDLPKVASVKAEEYGSVAEGLRKMAARHAEETRDDVLAAAVTIMEKGSAVIRGRPRVPRAPAAPPTPPPPAAPPASLGPTTGVQPRVHWYGGQLEGPKAQAEHRRFRLLERAEEAKIPLTPAYKEHEVIHAFTEKTKAETEALKHTPEIKRQMISTAPMAALALGVPVAGAAMMAGGRGKDKESVKIYK